MTNYTVVIPALNPGEDLIDYVNALLNVGFTNIIVVNDGSNEDLTYIFSEIDKIDQCTVLHHQGNKGKGRALKTAFNYYLEHYPHHFGIITADADGQHAVDDVYKVAQALKKENHLILGTRNFKETNVPKRSYLGNTITSFAFDLLFRVKLQDTQTGLRAIPTKELKNIVKLRGERYEYEINMLIYATKRKLSIKEVTIQTIYHNNNEGSYYKTIRDSWKIFRKLMGGFLYFNWRYKNLIKEGDGSVGGKHV